MSQIKMEKAFVKGLKHVLSKKYKYVIVADRGFGNIRFVRLCEENGLDSVLRVNSNLIIKRDTTFSEESQEINLKTQIKDEQFNAYVVNWKEEKWFTVCCKNGPILTNMVFNENPQLNSCEIYENRFKIEKNYQDCKSSGYDIEKNKIRKYDRFKRLTYCIVLAHAITCFLGFIINYTKNTIKKTLR